jgi:hypothetical protein
VGEDHTITTNGIGEACSHERDGREELHLESRSVRRGRSCWLVGLRLGQGWLEEYLVAASGPLYMFPDLVII